MKLAGIVLLWLVAVAHATPATDLASPSQATRDTAAKVLRASYRPPARATWTRLLASIKLGSTKPQVVAQLAPYHTTEEMGLAGGGAETVHYRLDDRWLLRCSFSTRGDATLLAVGLTEQLRHVWVEPPAQFTGVWTVYFASGRRSHEIHYENGAYAGVFTSFHPTGRKAVVQTYAAGRIEGDDIGYHPSGRIAYRGRYAGGKRVGTWTHYDGRGKVTSTERLPD